MSLRPKGGFGVPVGDRDRPDHWPGRAVVGRSIEIGEEQAQVRPVAVGLPQEGREIRAAAPVEDQLAQVGAAGLEDLHAGDPVVADDDD